MEALCGLHHISTLSILFLRFKIDADVEIDMGDDSFQFSFWDSISFAWWMRIMILMTFNSLFEIQQKPYKPAKSKNPAFNSLFEIPLFRISYTSSKRVKTFNSLFEIHNDARKAPEQGGRKTFNSLFEILAYGPGFNNLLLGLPFQFSFWDSHFRQDPATGGERTFNSLFEILFIERKTILATLLAFNSLFEIRSWQT